MDTDWHGWGKGFEQEETEGTEGTAENGIWRAKCGIAEVNPGAGRREGNEGGREHACMAGHFF